MRSFVLIAMSLLVVLAFGFALRCARPAAACTAASCMSAPCSKTNLCPSPCGCMMRDGQPWGRCVEF